MRQGGTRALAPSRGSGQARPSARGRSREPAPSSGGARLAPHYPKSAREGIFVRRGREHCAGGLWRISARWHASAPPQSAPRAASQRHLRRQTTHAQVRQRPLRLQQWRRALSAAPPAPLHHSTALQYDNGRTRNVDELCLLFSVAHLPRGHICFGLANILLKAHRAEVQRPRAPPPAPAPSGCCCTPCLPPRETAGESA